jgi:uncharacterized RDD family membrane protein YckC
MGEPALRVSDDELIIDSATGVDVQLRVAGPGSRSYAFLLDWNFRFVLALAWYIVAALIYNGRLSIAPPGVPDGDWFLAVIAPAMAIFFLYHYVLEVAMRGRTPGKRIAGVRLVTREGNTPSTGALLARNVFRVIDSVPFFYSIGLITTMITRTHVRIGDLAAGTVLVHDRIVASPGPVEARGAVQDAALRELVLELLQRWPTLHPGARRRLAQRLLAASQTPQMPPAQSPDDADEAHLHARLEALLRGPS